MDAAKRPSWYEKGKDMLSFKKIRSTFICCLLWGSPEIQGFQNRGSDSLSQKSWVLCPDVPAGAWSFLFSPSEGQPVPPQSVINTVYILLYERQKISILKKWTTCNWKNYFSKLSLVMSFKLIKLEGLLAINLIFIYLKIQVWILAEPLWNVITSS